MITESKGAQFETDFFYLLGLQGWDVTPRPLTTYKNMDAYAGSCPKSVIADKRCCINELQVPTTPTACRDG